MKTLYLDWSGDAGFKFRRGASRYLTLACVTSETPFSDSLNPLRERYSLGRAFYFRFTAASEFIKPVFFTALAEADLQGIVLRVDKPQLEPSFHRMRGLDLLAYFAAETVSRIPNPGIEDRSLIFDGLRAEQAITQIIRVAVSTTLRARNLPLLKRVTARPAREEDGLQVADLLAGAAASVRLKDTALLGNLSGKVELVDYGGEK